MSLLAELRAVLGPDAGAVFHLMRIPPDAPSTRASSIHEAFFLWALDASGVPPVTSSLAVTQLRCLKERLLSDAGVPGLTLPGRAPVGRPPTWSALAPHPAPNHSWVELMASRVVIPAQAVGYAMHTIFRERATLDTYNKAVRQAPGLVLFSFRDRAVASGCAHLLPICEVDSSVGVVGQRSSAEPPRKRVARAADGLASGPDRSFTPLMVRPPEAIAREAALRLMASSVANSWPTYVSGLRCWGAFMDMMFPMEPHFPARAEHLSQYACIFRNGATFEKYVSHLHYAERLFLLDSPVSRSIWGGIVRGAGKFNPRVEGPAYREPDVLRLVRAAAAAGRLDLVRVFVVARAWLLRVHSELLPLQSNGRAGKPASSLDWHSQITLEAPPPRPRVRLTWRTRKNRPQGDSAVRSCTCGSSLESRLLCGPCAVLGAVRDAARAGRSPSSRLFPDLQGSAHTASLSALAVPLGLKPAWHAFRRGMAQDMLARGDPLAEILLAGGWRSGAFLRYLCRIEVDKEVALHYAQVDSGPED